MSVNWCETCKKYTNNCGCSTSANQGTGEFVGGFYVIRGENQGGGSSWNSSGANGNGTSNGGSNRSSNGRSNGNSDGTSNGSSSGQ
ncbi:hypothetical protein PspLS_01135 [Pyricularia sp. CBS 133598]|nr:hypothetical protein PspLS_01135 [Pyricularia sp. CBS 133598]